MDHDASDLNIAEGYLDVVRQAQKDAGDYRVYVRELEELDYHSLHPMMRDEMGAIGSLEYELCVDEAEVKGIFAKAEKTLVDYIAGNYGDTEMYLMANYAHEENGRSVEGMSICVYRQNGETTYRVSHEELRQGVTRAIERINPRQTDSWYLSNLGRLLPVELSDGFKLKSWNVSEGSDAGGNN